jgi:galactokinase
MADSNSKKNELKIYTKLNEIYSEESIESSKESEYEDLRSKYNFLYKNDPTTIIRVPYTATLFGDTITQLFSNKIVANLSSELIILFNKNTTNELNIKYFDNIQQIKTTIGELNELNLSNKEEFTLNDFAIIGYLSAFKHIKSNNNNNGSNILIMLNNPNREENDCYISIFLAMFLCCLYINDMESIVNNSINKSSLYEMVVLTLTEICEQNKKLRDLININFYTPDIYFKIFLEKNSFGFNQGNLFYQSPVSLDNSPLSLLVFDSLSPEPIKYYSSSKYWNKRKVEVRLAMALMIKRFKENISQEDLIKNSSTIEEFLKVFENNYEIVLKSIDVYLKKETYNLNELKAELPVDKLLKDINNFQGALLTKEFKLYDRILFIIKEYELVSLLYYKMKIGENINWKEKILESAKLLRENYYCYSDEMLKLEAELKISMGESIPLKCISKGWTGKMVIIGTNKELEKYESYIGKKYEKLIEGEGLVNAWISDEVNKYCFISLLEKGISILDPKYEDFMLEYIKHKNNIESSDILKEKLK